NDYLQLMGEGGALVGLPVLESVAAFVVAVRRKFKSDTSATVFWLRAGAVTGLIAVGFQEIVDFSLQMPGNALLFAVLCAIALHDSRMKVARDLRPVRHGSRIDDNGRPTASLEDRGASAHVRTDAELSTL